MNDIRRIIDGKVYDTTTAKLVCTVVDQRGAPWRDFHAETTRLYLTRKGQWFLAGEGGALTRWGDDVSCGEGLALISQDEARKMVEGVNGPVELFFACDEG